MIKGAVSPMARDSPRMMLVIMPGSAAGSTWCHTVCQRVAPSAKDACRMEAGTARSASREAMMVTGRISRLMGSAHASRPDPVGGDDTSPLPCLVDRGVELLPARLAML